MKEYNGKKLSLMNINNLEWYLQLMDKSVSIGCYQIPSYAVKEHDGAFNIGDKWYIHTLNLNNTPAYELFKGRAR